MSQIIAFPRGQLSAEDRARIEAIGMVAVEADDPRAVVLTIPGVPLASSDDLAIAALTAVVGSRHDSVGAEFARKLHRIIAARQQHTSHGAGVSDE